MYNQRIVLLIITVVFHILPRQHLALNKSPAASADNRMQCTGSVKRAQHVASPPSLSSDVQYAFLLLFFMWQNSPKTL